jgi:hypothetical protein
MAGRQALRNLPLVVEAAVRLLGKRRLEAARLGAAPSELHPMERLFKSSALPGAA